MATVLSPPEERIVLSNVSWETYEQLLANYADSSGPRFTYDRGVLEIMSPSSEHEEINDAIKLFVYTVGGEMSIHVKGFGSTTFRREDLERGFEPDSCFYIQNARSIRGVSKLDLSTHPPPDVIVEIDITSPSLKKFPIYAAVGVPEVWHYNGSLWKIFRLEGGDYIEAEESLALPRITGEVLTRFLEGNKSEDLADWLRDVRSWARKNSVE